MCIGTGNCITFRILIVSKFVLQHQQLVCYTCSRVPLPSSINFLDHVATTIHAKGEWNQNVLSSSWVTSQGVHRYTHRWIPHRSIHPFIYLIFCSLFQLFLICFPCCWKVNGVWSLWGSWGDCSVTCENGTRQRTRTCSHPPQKYAGKPCDGETAQYKPCQMDLCPGESTFYLHIPRLLINQAVTSVGLEFSEFNLTCELTQ